MLKSVHLYAVSKKTVLKNSFHISKIIWAKVWSIIAMDLPATMILKIKIYKPDAIYYDNIRLVPEVIL